ncbi:hypothetical protein [Vibrio owensii]|uniref:hypothetical protein n=1 Tax=Vibrio owensii TaxID=696485 RepID=UPI004068A33D
MFSMFLFLYIWCLKNGAIIGDDSCWSKTMTHIQKKVNKLKKIAINTILLSALASSASFADDVTDKWDTLPTDGARDNASAAIEFIAKVPTIVAGKWITFTGEAGGTLESGKFNISTDGQFTTSKPVTLELHWYDPDTNATGDLVSDKAVGKFPFHRVKIDSLEYTVSKVDFTSVSGLSDVEDAEALVKVDDNIIKPDMPFDPASTTTLLDNPAVTHWSIENKSAATVFGHVAAGDSINATATVTADISFISTLK